MQIDIERIIHSLKTGLGCLVGFAITKALHNYLFFDQWLIVTILVVMCAQISVGSIIFKSTARFIGTCIGSLLAAFTIITFGNDTWMFAAAIAFAGIIFSYFATGQQTYSDAGTLGAVTTAIILINPDPTLTLTAERFMEISIGIIIATLISQFVLPIHARNHLRRSQAQAIRLLGQFYSQACATSVQDKEKFTELDDKIVQSLSLQRKQATEAKRELLGSRFEVQKFKAMMDAEKQILRSIDFLNRLFNEYQFQTILAGNNDWQRFNQTLETVFENIARKVEDQKTQVTAINLPSVTALKETIEQFNRADVLFFCLDNITRHLGDLAAAVA